jgi:hypothetical protein
MRNKKGGNRRELSEKQVGKQRSWKSRKAGKSRKAEKQRGSTVEK